MSSSVHTDFYTQILISLKISEIAPREGIRGSEKLGPRNFWGTIYKRAVPVGDSEYRRVN